MRVQAFLRGAEVSMTLTNFNDSRHASNYARKHRHDVDNSSFTMSSGATVTITKTLNLNRNAGVSYETEARALAAVCGEELEEVTPAAQLAQGSLPCLPSLNSLLRSGTSASRGRTRIARHTSLKHSYNDVISIDSD